MAVVSVLALGHAGYALAAREAVQSILEWTSFDVHVSCDANAAAVFDADPRVQLAVWPVTTSRHRPDFFLAKLHALERCLKDRPDELIIQLDADAVIARPLDDAMVEAALDRSVMAMVEQTKILAPAMQRADLYRHYVETSLRFLAPETIAPGLEEFHYYNSGVLLSRRAGISAFLDWALELRRRLPAEHRINDNMIADQDYFQVWANSVAPGACRKLSWEWNHCAHWDEDFPRPEAYILHLSNFCMGPSLETVNHLNRLRRPRALEQTRTPEQDTITFVVVTYNSERCLEACLKAASRFGPTLVVDNASEDRSAEIAGRLGALVHCMPCNEGFAAAANRGARLATTRHICFLNPDCFVSKNAVDQARYALELDPRGLVVPEYIEWSGKRVAGRQPGYTRTKILADILEAAHPKVARWLRRLPWLDDEQWHWPLAACLFVTRDGFASIGGFDQTYFCYMEDVALGLAAARKGAPVRQLDASVLHLGQHGSAVAAPARVGLISAARLKYAEVHYGTWFVRLVRTVHRGLDWLRQCRRAVMQASPVQQ